MQESIHYSLYLLRAVLPPAHSNSFLESTPTIPPTKLKTPWYSARNKYPAKWKLEFTISRLRIPGRIGIIYNQVIVLLALAEALGIVYFREAISGLLLPKSYQPVSEGLRMMAWPLSIVFKGTLRDLINFVRRGWGLFCFTTQGKSAMSKNTFLMLSDYFVPVAVRIDDKPKRMNDKENTYACNYQDGDTIIKQAKMGRRSKSICT